VAVPSRHDRAWEDWGSVDPLYAILTDPKYRHGAGDRAEFMDSGEDFAASILGRCEALGLATGRGGALDFGCGVGRVSAPLSTSFETVVGLDVSPSMVETARRLHATRPNCRFEVQRTTDLRQYSDASFDLVLCVLVLQHLGSQQAILRYLAEFVRVLAPGGALVVQIPSKVPPLDWVPEMTMTSLPDARTRTALVENGASVVFVTPTDVDRGGTESCIYFATRP
jgi:SAM-dependent methyltransferase